MPHTRNRRDGAVAAAALLVLPLAGTFTAAQPEPESRSAWFGDLHLHTSYSFDAAASGTATTPDDAYRYARGEAVQYFGRTVRRNTPLDFLAVTDHSEYLGVATQAADPAGVFAATDWPRRLADLGENTIGYMRVFSASAFAGTDSVIAEFDTAQIRKDNWQREIEAAEQFNNPGVFTTFVAYEWSPMPGGAHLHRNVIFKGPDYPEQPFTAFDSRRPEDLWTYAEQHRDRGIDSLLIPHNSNMSQGLMFAAVDSEGEPITGAYARRRQQNERLVEIVQNKGTSETRPEFAPADEFAGFELLTLAAETDADPAGGYVRPALARGLAVEAATGVNPFRFGLIGSTDFHSGVSGTEEDNFSGALGRSDDIGNPRNVLETINPVARAPATIFSAGGLTGLWAESNTRESLFAALQRREAFATSGTRIQVRLFAGNFPAGTIDAADWVARGYALGVPMGAILRQDSIGDAAPTFLIHATKDPDGANLDRAQIVKIWLEEGEPREAVFDAVWAGDRAPDPLTGRLPSIGSTVDVSTASYSNTIGAGQLHGQWRDPSFNKDQPSVYYVRVLEIPTPRWSTYLAVRNGLELSEAVPAELRERAWSSPIFYEP